ncbi:MAG TPA: methyl-accepting chemotaxis protein [Methanospirillum sp.]|nr:methyl-accepting chemotaxis protein [Methanospirillum sp.]
MNSGISKQGAAADSFIQHIAQGSYAFTCWDEFLDSFPVPVLLCDHTLSISQANEAFLIRSGFLKETMQGMHFRNLSVSLLSGESVWDAALSGRITSGVAEVVFPKGSGFYEIRALPTIPEGASTPVILIFFIEPDRPSEFPSYDSIRRSLSHQCEILAELDGTILSMTSGHRIPIPADVLVHNNILKWDVLAQNPAIQELTDEPGTEIRFMYEDTGSECSFLMTVQVCFVTLLKRSVLFLTVKEQIVPVHDSVGHVADYSALSLALEQLAHALSTGNFSHRFEIEDPDESLLFGITAINSMMEQVQQQFSALSEGISQMNSGWIPLSIQAPQEGPFTGIIQDLNGALDSLQLMIATVESFTMSVMEGNLTMKGDTSGLSGYYQAMVAGMNQMLVRLNTPLLEMKRVAKSYAACEFSARMDENIAYPGDFASMKESMDSIGIWCSAVVGEIDRVSSRYAAGDFTAHMSSKLQVSGDFTTIRSSLDNIGVQVSESITVLRNAADVLTIEAEGIKREIAAVSGQAETLAAYTAAVSDRAASVQEEVREMIASADTAMQALCEMNEKVQEVAQTSARTHEMSSQGVILATQSREGIDAISEAASSVDSGISRIHAELISIEKIIRVVTDIANQTNLLAINAAIEAAHAGSYGKGFAVVASEVKHLAVQSKESTTSISQTLTALHDTFREVRDKVSQVQEEIASRSHAICEMVHLFEKMAGEVEVIASMSRETGVLSQEQERRIADLNQRAGTIGELMIETARDAGASAQACASSCRSIEQISGHIEAVARYAEEIHGGIRGFTV